MVSAVARGSVSGDSGGGPETKSAEAWELEGQAKHLLSVTTFGPSLLARKDAIEF